MSFQCVALGYSCVCLLTFRHSVWCHVYTPPKLCLKYLSTSKIEYASPKVTKYQVYHSFMSSYIFIHQLFYIRVILSYIYVKTISSVSVWFLLYRAISSMHQINHCFIHEVVNIFISSCVHIFIHQERGWWAFDQKIPSRRGVWRRVIGVYSRVHLKRCFYWSGSVTLVWKK